MKQKNMYAFFLEIIFSLILLTIAIIVALLLFTYAAKIDKDNRAIADITQEMVAFSEVLRSPDNTYISKFEPAIPKEKVTFYGYDANGDKASSGIVYQLAIYIRSEASGKQQVRKSRLELINMRDGKIITGWLISTLPEVQP